MPRIQRFVLAAFTALALCACGLSLPPGESGSIAMMPHVDADRGFQGIVPAGCQQIQVGTWLCESLIDSGPILLTQHALDLPPDILLQELRKDTDIEEMPDPHSVITVKGLSWRLYSLEAQIYALAELIPGPLHIEMALADLDDVTYMVAVSAAVPDYSENPQLCDSLFRHIVHSLRPWNSGGGEG